MNRPALPAHRFLNRLFAGALAVAAVQTLLLVPGSAVTCRFAFLPLAALFFLLAGLLGTILVERARVFGMAGYAARQQQVFAVVPLALIGAGLAWFGRPDGVPSSGYAPAVAVLASMFPVLLMERFLAARAFESLADAQPLRALARVVLLAGSAACLLEIGAFFGIAIVVALAAVIACLVSAIGIEVALRAAGRLFLPTPAPEEARAACVSWLAASLTGGMGNPVLSRFGLDFTRSWALGYVRATIWPMMAFFGVLGWGLSGLAVVPLDGRAVYERLGVPVQVLRPGLSLILPWPMGKLRQVEFGAVHDIGLISDPPQHAHLPAAAEAPAPPSADRLWGTPHENEVTLVIASSGSGHQSFQTVSADLRLLYRVGLTDTQARDAAYGTADPDTLVRAVAARAITAYFAMRRLDEALGGAREAIAEQLRSDIQTELSTLGCGLDMVAVVIEAIHPPAGAAAAYHAVRAAEIAAQAAISGERGSAIVVRAQAKQYEDGTVSAAQASASETVETARTLSVRFASDLEASKRGSKVFALERYFFTLDTALSKTPKTILDHRLSTPATAVLDLRPPYTALPPTGSGD